MIEKTVSGMGYDLIDVERLPGGLLRVTIDMPWLRDATGTTSQAVTIDDCEKVTRQLQFALEVEGASYERLEVSSPGIDRPLRHAQDFERFVGEVIDITLKQPIGAALQAEAKVAANRKKFRGVLEAVEPQQGQAQRWQIVWSDEPAAKPGLRVSKKKRAPAPVMVLGFALDELSEARLAPIVDFRGRSRKSAAEPDPQVS